MDLNVEKLHPKDWSYYKRIRLEALLDTPIAYGRSHEESSEFPDEYWKECLENVWMARNPVDYWRLFLKKGEKVVGMVGADLEVGDHCGHIASIVGMYVSPDCRGKGAGRLLLDTLLERIKDENPNITKVNLQVNTFLESAFALYERRGFVTEALLKDELLISGEYHHLYQMALRIKK